MAKIKRFLGVDVPKFGTLISSIGLILCGIVWVLNIVWNISARQTTQYHRWLMNDSLNRVILTEIHEMKDTLTNHCSREEMMNKRIEKLFIIKQNKQTIDPKDFTDIRFNHFYISKK